MVGSKHITGSTSSHAAIFISLVSSGIVMAEREKQVVIPFLYTVC